ncbi:MAG: 2-amino-4-hydroxy-6-hydroxymethyldihydropteridine diphosphokinase [Nisaea sp.]|uniref:2-amino-4-hydroxy-6- hydroxymethyldihydropteridine diphosphokinase n=1 Tax=Nisaea sp. TaxID=2024842 RepID=UPI001B267ACD|nr:2-amino-4-hydroxy-6-hydroxymethyldihydropteridine diphosphokinase [Nisaea sp.]MBO6562612.1 2-amino-4-hydroxy-6-hydroxymethyldihydropteridine diphosphokinase [Nisaea sp.]
MIFLGVGANLPSPRFSSPRETLEAAVRDLGGAGIVSLAVSRWYETAPVPISDQPWYVNAVYRVETDLDPVRLLEALHRVEAEYGRVRGEVNGPRVIDLDLLDYRGLCRDGAGDGAGPVLPHPRLHERAFVLLPLRDLAPGWTHPRSGASIDRLIAELDPEQTARPLGS